MRSVRDTFIINHDKSKDKTNKTFSLVYGIKHHDTEENYQTFDVGQCAFYDTYAASGMTALSCLVFKYTNREHFLITYRFEKERMMDIRLSKEYAPADIFQEISDRSGEEPDAALIDAADILLDFSDTSEYPKDMKHNMIINVQADGGKVSCSARYKASVYQEAYAKQIAGHWFSMFHNQVCGNTQKLSELRLDTKEEIIQKWNGVKSSGKNYNYDFSHSIIEEFYHGFHEHMNDAALCDEKGELTYQQLDSISNQIANMLRVNGVMKGDHVVVIGERSRFMILSILAILKLGAAYVPIDMELPSIRIRYIMQDVRAKNTILLNRVPGDEDFENVLTLDNLERYSKEFQGESVDGGDNAYILYTSGTTGKPKGVIVRHSSVVNLSKWFGETYNLKQNRHVLHMTNMSFDVSVEETITTLLNFAVIYLIPQDIKLNRQKFAAYISDNGISIAQFVPVTLKELLGDEPKIECLNVVICGGDRLDDDLKNEILAKGYHLFNHYGPTECTVDAVACQCEPDSNDLGRPIANTEVYIIDEDKQLQTFGVAGELCIAGAGMSGGYYRKKEMTEEKFVWIPSLHKKVYRTGDLAIMQPNGKLIFIGRSDQQVKINGLRIELEEIEFYFKQYPGILEAVVTVINNNYGGRALCVYYKSNASVIYKKVKNFLSKYLPQYMIPNHYIRISEWPVTVNGKIDQEMLRKWEISARNTKYIAPESKTEKAVSNIWRRILGHDRISVEDEFINVGGDSLRAAILSNLLMETFHVQILPNRILTYTIRDTANTIDSGLLGEEPAEDDTLLLMKSGSDPEKHIFLVHAGSGEAEVFVDLCDNLSGDYHLWGIRADRLTDDSPRNITLEEIAETYVKRLEAIQPKGCCHLIGWCIGGSIAFEMGLQLEKKGRKLGFFAMINSFAPDREFWGEVPAFSIHTEIQAAKRLPRFEAFKVLHGKIESISDLWCSLLDYYSDIGLSAEELKECVYDDMDRAIPYYDSDNITVRDIIYYMNVLRTFDNVRACYVPERKLNVQAYFFAAADETAANFPVWDQYCEKPMRVYKMKGNNFSILQYPDVLDFAEQLNTVLSCEGV